MGFFKKIYWIRNQLKFQLSFDFYNKDSVRFEKMSSYKNFKRKLFSLFNLHRFFIIDSFSKITKNINHNSILEFIWTLLPSIILILLAVPSLFYLYKVDYFFVEGGSLLTIKVIGSQWFWSYEIYNIVSKSLICFDSYMLFENQIIDGMLRLLETDNPLILPICTPIRFLITSTDVLHSWAVPSFGIKMDACPGRLNQFFVFLDREGEFYGQCSEICGINHGFMPIDVIVINKNFS